MHAALKVLLGASLAANAALGAYVFQATTAARRYYWHKWTASATPTPAPTPRAQVLATPPPIDPNYSHRRLERVAPRHAYAGQSGPAFAGWRRSAHQAFVDVLGYAPRPFGGRVVHTEHTDYPAFTRDKLYLQAADGLWIPAVLLLPKGARAPRPAVLALPGHDWGAFAGVRSITGDDVPDNYMAAFGLRLVEAGYPVLAVDVPAIGELNKLNYTHMVKEGLQIDETLKVLMLETAHLAVDYMRTRPEIAPDRIGTMGVSLGGELAGFSAALDSRIAFAVMSGFMSSYKDIGAGSTDALFIPGILNALEIPDIVGLIAPRPLLVQMGRKDHNFDFPRFEVHMGAVRRIFAGAGAPQAVATDIHDGGHRLVPATAIAWLEKNFPIEKAP